MKNLIRSFVATVLLSTLVVLVGCIEVPTDYRVITMSYICVVDNDTLFTFDGMPMHLDTIACTRWDESVDTTTVTP